MLMQGNTASLYLCGLLACMELYSLLCVGPEHEVRFENTFKTAMLHLYKIISPSISIEETMHPPIGTSKIGPSLPASAVRKLIRTFPHIQKTKKIGSTRGGSRGSSPLTTPTKRSGGFFRINGDGTLPASGSKEKLISAIAGSIDMDDSNSLRSNSSSCCSDGRMVQRKELILASIEKLAERSLDHPGSPLSSRLHQSYYEAIAGSPMLRIGPPCQDGSAPATTLTEGCTRTFPDGNRSLPTKIPWKGPPDILPSPNSKSLAVTIPSAQPSLQRPPPPVTKPVVSPSPRLAPVSTANDTKIILSANAQASRFHVFSGQNAARHIDRSSPAKAPPPPQGQPRPQPEPVASITPPLPSLDSEKDESASGASSARPVPSSLPYQPLTLMQGRQIAPLSIADTGRASTSASAVALAVAPVVAAAALSATTAPRPQSPSKSPHKPTAAVHRSPTRHFSPRSALTAMAFLTANATDSRSGSSGSVASSDSRGSTPLRPKKLVQPRFKI